MLAALLNVPANVGYSLLFVLVGAESAGALVPGETSLDQFATLGVEHGCLEGVLVDVDRCVHDHGPPLLLTPRPDRPQNDRTEPL